MQFTINRGIPKIYSSGIFSQDGSNVFTTLFARQVDSASTAILTPSLGGLYTFSSGEYIAQRFIDKAYNKTITATASDAILIYGYLELDPFTNQTPNAPLAGSRGPAPTFNILPVQIFKNGPETLVHSLDKNFMDLVTLKVNVPKDASITFRFYDGTFSAGVANYESYTLFETTAGPETLFDAHPMLGPGKITVVRNAAADVYTGPVAVYGAYIRNG